MVKFHVRKLPFMFPVVVVLGFILWKWANGSDSADPNLDCRIGSKVFADGSSHCFTSIRKLGNRRSSERLRRFNSSKGTNLAILIILAGDIETNPGPRYRCSLCKKILQGIGQGDRMYWLRKTLSCKMLKLGS